MISPTEPSRTGFSLMLYRMARSARMDGEMFRLLREDSSATVQSIITLAIAGLSLGLGFTASIGDDLRVVFLGGLAGIFLGLLIGFVWLSLTYIVVTRLFKAASSYWGLGRPIFFASSPALIFLLMLILGTSLAPIISTVGLAWIALSNVFAIKNAVGFDNQRSFLTFIIAAFVLLIVYGLITSL